MTRRSRATGRFKASRADLFAHVKSRPQVKSAATKRARWLLLRNATTNALRCELGMAPIIDTNTMLLDKGRARER